MAAACKDLYPPHGNLSKPGYQCDKETHSGNHSETIKEYPITVTIEWDPKNVKFPYKHKT